MPYKPKKQLNGSNEIGWKPIAVVAIVLLAGSVLVGQWLGKKLLETRVGVKAPPPAFGYPAPSLSPEGSSPIAQTAKEPSQPERQQLASPPLVIPPPAMESERPSPSTASSPTPTPAATPSETPTPKPSPSASVKKETKPNPVEVYQGSKHYRVQAGIFSNAENAKDLINHLREQGYNSSYEMISHPEGAYYRVWVGPYDTRDEAQSTAQELNGIGYQAFVLGDESPTKR